MIYRHLFSGIRYASLRFLSGGLSILLMLLVSQPVVSFAEETEVVDRIVAVVNDDIVVLQDIDKLLGPMKTELLNAGYSPEQMNNMLAKMRQRAIDQLINEKLIKQAAIEYELKVEKSEIEESIERIKEGNNFTDEQLIAALKENGRTMETFRSELLDQILSSKLENIEVGSRIVITKEDVAEYYNQHADEYLGEKTYHLKNILIRSQQTGSTADKEAVDNKIELILSEFNSGKSFESLAKQYSESPFAGEGGELGKFRLNDLSSNLKAAVEPLSPGDITPALETSEGYQILYVDEIIQKPDTPLESVYDEIENKLYEEQYNTKKKAWTEKLRKDAHIRIIE